MRKSVHIIAALLLAFSLWVWWFQAYKVTWWCSKYSICLLCLLACVYHAIQVFSELPDRIQSLLRLPVLAGTSLGVFGIISMLPLRAEGGVIFYSVAIAGVLLSLLLSAFASLGRLLESPGLLLKGWCFIVFLIVSHSGIGVVMAITS